MRVTCELDEPGKITYWKYRGFIGLTQKDAIENWSDWVFNIGNEKLHIDALDELLHLSIPGRHKS